MNNMIELRNVRKKFHTDSESLEILSGINLDITQGSRVSITGESGSGKSTLLHLAGGLDNVTEGNVRVNGLDITHLEEVELSLFRNKTIGFIFQAHYLLEEFSALENVMLPYLMHTYNKKDAREKALHLMSLVGMSHRLHHHPSKLSGGERQRTAIARALINSPPLILADEPTGNLDNANADKVVDILFNITAMHTLVIVTHSESIASLADIHYHLHNGQLEKRSKA